MLAAPCLAFLMRWHLSSSKILSVRFTGTSLNCLLQELPKEYRFFSDALVSLWFSLWGMCGLYWMYLQKYALIYVTVDDNVLLYSGNP